MSTSHRLEASSPKVRFPPIANLEALGDHVAMRLIDLVEASSRRAPLVIGFASVTAVGGAWLKAPALPFYVFTAALVILATAVWARRGFSRLFKSMEQLGFTRNRDWLRFKFTASGMPRGYYALGFVPWLAVWLTGFQFPYAALALAAIALAVAWGEDRRCYPADDPDIGGG